MCCLKRAGGASEQEKEEIGGVMWLKAAQRGDGGCIAQRPLQETLLEWVNWKNIVGSLSGSFNYGII